MLLHQIVTQSAHHSHTPVFVTVLGVIAVLIIGFFVLRKRG